MPHRWEKLWVYENPLVPDSAKIRRTDEEWLALLGPERFRIARQAATEPPFSGTFWLSRAPGLYKCACCGWACFSSRDKYPVLAGWPTFARALSIDHVDEKPDHQLSIRRTCVVCPRCDATLGHLFEDVPDRLRYCLNSAALDFEPDPHGLHLVFLATPESAPGSAPGGAPSDAPPGGAGG